MNMLRHCGQWLRRGIGSAGVLLAALLWWAPAEDASAQIARNYSVRFKTNVTGDVVQIGNGNMTCSLWTPATPSTGDCLLAQQRTANPTGVVNNAYNMRYLRADNGAFGPSFNSSSADLAMPAGATVRFAGLYWGGSLAAGAARNTMSFKTPATGGYTSITATQFDAIGQGYAGFADVTALVQAGGVGTYWGANITSTDNSSDRWAGWSVFVVFESNTLPLRNLVVFDGFGLISDLAGQTISLSGFLTPASGPVVTKVGSYGYDGDLGFVGDALQVRSSTNPVYTTITDAANPPNDFFNSTIADGGVPVTTRYPSFPNTLGLDLDRFTLPSGIVGNSATTADFLLNTGGEFYYPHVISFATDLYVPIISQNLVKTVSDLNGGSILPGDILRWTIAMSNTGLDSGTNLVMVDPIPPTVTYIPGSMVVINGPTGPANGGMTDAISDSPTGDRADFRTGPNRVVFRLGAGAGTGVPGNDQANGGVLAYTQATSVQFDTVVNTVPAGTVISNSATIYYSGQTLSAQSFSSASSATSATVLGPPTIAKSFSPSFIAAGASSQLKITVANPAANPANLTGVGFPDNYPTGLVNATPSLSSIVCTAGSTPGTIGGGTAGGNSISLAGTTLLPGGSCDVTVNVTAAVGGIYVNTAGAVVAANSATGLSSTATLTAGKLGLSKSFTPTTIQAGQAASLSVTITNPGVAITGGTFVDVFPVGLVVTGTAVVSPNPPCGVGSILLDSGGGALALGSTGISLQPGAAGGTIAANSSCTFSVSVGAAAGVSGGIFNNSIPVGASHSADAVPGLPSNTATLTIVRAPAVVKTFNPATVNTGDTTTVSITVSNPNTTTTITQAGTAFTDTYPNVSMVNTTPANVSINCSGGSSASVVGGVQGGSTIGLQNVSLAPNGSCTVTSVIATAGIANGTYTNSTGNVTLVNAPAGGPATASVLVTGLVEPTVTKSFSTTAVSAGSAVTMTIVLTNPAGNGGSAVTGAAFVDTFPFGMVNTSGAATIAPAGCGGTATVSASALTVTGVNVPGSGGRTCTITTTVATNNPGSYFNTTGNITSTVTPPQTTPGTASLAAFRGLDITKAFTPSAIATGTGTAVMTITINNPSGNPGVISASSIVDTFPAGMQVATGGAASVNAGCVPGPTPVLDNNAGVLVANGDTAVRLQNYTVAIGTPCIITISAVRVITGGSFVNTVQTIVSSNSGFGAFPVAINGTSGSATLTAGKVGITKAFSPATISVGGTSTLTFTLSNTSAVAVSGLNFTDLLTSLPTRQITLASGAVGGTCTGVVSNAASGGTSFVVTAGNVPASASCTITVQVTSSVTGSNPNQTTGVTHATDPVPGTVSNIATLTVTPPPTVVKSFSPSEVGLGLRSTLSVTVTNINNFPITNVAVTDTFPAGLLVATPLASSNSCGGTLNNSGGGALGAGDVGFQLSGASVATNSSCVIAIAVSAATSGAYVNTIPAGALTSDSGSNPNPASATLNVLLPLTAVKSFTPNAIAAGGTSVLTVRLTNPNAIAVTGAAFSDTYPASLVNTASPAGSTSCPGGSVGAVAGAGNGAVALTLSTATVPANNFCDITVNVTSAVAGVRTNAAFNVTTTNAGTAVSNPASLSVGVPAITKTFSPNPIAPGGVTTISFVISNPTGAAMNNVGFSDTFPAGMTLSGVPATPQCAGTLYLANGTTTPPTAGGGSVRMGSSTGTNGGTIAANSSCTVTVAVTTPAAGVRINTTTAVTSGASIGNTATDTLTTFSPPAVSKSFAPTAVGIGQASVLTVRLDNSNAFAMTGAAFTDNYPSFMVNAASPSGATTCGGGLVTAAGGGGSVALSGATIPASGFCLVTVNVVATTSGALVNTIAANAVTTSNAGSNASAASATLTVLAAPVAVKDFIGPNYASFGLTGTTMPLNTATPMRISLTNPNTTAITGVSFADAYPSGLINSTPPNAALAGAGCVGTLSATSGGSALDLTGGTIPASTTCTITVNVQSAISNFYTNSTGPISTGNAGTGVATSGSIYVMAPLAVSKAFTPNFIVNPPGTATSGMTVTLVNPNPYPVTGTAITDNYDSGNIDNVNPPLPTLTGTAGCAGTITAANGASAMTFAAGSVPTSGTCVINVVVNLTPAGTNGVFTNCTDGITTANAGAATNVCATITKGAAPTTLPPVIAKSFTPSTIPVNGVSTLSFTITNPNTVAINTVAFSDPLPAGLTVATPALASSNCGPGVWNATSGSVVVNLTGGTITASANCVLNVAVTGNASGIYTNTTGVVSANTGNGNQANAVLTILDAPEIIKSFSPSTISQGGASTISFVITNVNSSIVTGVAFTDTLTNMTIVNPPAPAVTGAGCTGYAITAPNGGSLISVSGGNIPARVGVTPGTCTITVRVTSAVAGVLPNATSQVTSSAGTGAGSNNATLTVNAVSVAVSGFVFVDTNANGTRNPSEDWTAGVLVYVNIVSGGAVIYSQAVNPGTGFFNFPAVAYGNYTIIVSNSPANATAVIPGGFNATAPATAAWNLPITGAFPPVVDFGFIGPALSQVTGQVFRDTGFSAGVANDGILTAGEAGSSPGLSGVTVAVTDCASTTFATTATDGGGNYTLRFPSTATTVCIVETNLNGYLSTGASQSATAIGGGNCAAPPGGGVFQYDRANDRICFSKTSGVNVNLSALNFGDVPVNTFVPDGAQQTTPGNVLFYPHTFTFESGGSVTFGSTVIATQPNIIGWSEVLYRDADCDGKLAASDVVLTPATSIVVTAANPPANKVCVVLRENVPPAAPFGAQRVVRVDAMFTYTGASGLFASYTRTDTSTVEDKSAAGIRLVKEVCNETTSACTDNLIDPSSSAGNGNYTANNTAKQGDVLRYRIIFSNTGSGSVTNLVINDAIPPFTNLNLLPACPVTISPPSLTCTQLSTPPGVSWTINGTVPSNAQGIVLYKVSVQ